MCSPTFPSLFAVQRSCVRNFSQRTMSKSHLRLSGAKALRYHPLFPVMVSWKLGGVSTWDKPPGSHNLEASYAWEPLDSVARVRNKDMLLNHWNLEVFAPAALLIPAALSQGRFCPTEDIWPCLEVFWVVTTGKGIPLASSGSRPEMLLHTVMHRTTSHNRELFGQKCQ